MFFAALRFAVVVVLIVHEVRQQRATAPTQETENDNLIMFSARSQAWYELLSSFLV